MLPFPLASCAFSNRCSGITGLAARRDLYCCASCRPAHHMLQRHYAVGPAAQLAANDSSEEEAGVGSLVEFERGKQYLLARVMKKTAQGWQVEVPR